MTENQGYVIAPVPVAPVNETDMVLFPEGLKALKKVAKEANLDLRGAYLNLDGGFDSAHNRKCIFNAGLIPNIKENPRNRKTTKRGRKRLFNAAIHALRLCVERTLAWEDKLDQRAHSNRKLRFQGFCRSIRLIERVFWSFYSTVRSDMQYWLAFPWPYNLLSDKVLCITVYSCAKAPAGP